MENKERQLVIQQLEQAKSAVYRINNIQNQFIEVSTESAEKIFSLEEEKAKACNSHSESIRIIRNVLSVPLFILIMAVGFMLSQLISNIFTGFLSDAINFLGIILSIVAAVKGVRFFSQLMQKLPPSKTSAAACKERENKLEKQIIALEVEYNNKKAELQNQLEIESEMEGASYLGTLIAEPYCTTDALENIINYFKSRRVDTLKEAYNLYEDERHKQKMLDMQQGQLDKLDLSLDRLGEQIRLQEKSLSSQEKALARQQRLSRQIRFGNALTVINTVKHWKKK